MGFWILVSGFPPRGFVFQVYSRFGFRVSRVSKFETKTINLRSGFQISRLRMYRGEVPARKGEEVVEAVQLLPLEIFEFRVSGFWFRVFRRAVSKFRFHSRGSFSSGFEFLYLYLHLSIPIYLSFHLSIYLSIYLSICIRIWVSECTAARSPRGRAKRWSRRCSFCPLIELSNSHWKHNACSEVDFRR